MRGCDDVHRSVAPLFVFFLLLQEALGPGDQLTAILELHGVSTSEEDAVPRTSFLTRKVTPDGEVGHGLLKRVALGGFGFLEGGPADHFTSGVEDVGVGFGTLNEDAVTVVDNLVIKPLLFQDVQGGLKARRR